jgi:hypothetical protein
LRFVGVGLLFLAHTWTADRFLPVSLIVAAAHLPIGCAFFAVVGRTPAGPRTS